MIVFWGRGRIGKLKLAHRTTRAVGFVGHPAGGGEVVGRLPGEVEHGGGAEEGEDHEEPGEVEAVAAAEPCA